MGFKLNPFTGKLDVVNKPTLVSLTPTLDPVWSTTNTAGEAVTGLILAAKANKTYDFHIFLKVKGYNTSGFKIAIGGPAGSTLAGTAMGSGANGGVTVQGVLVTAGTLCTASFAATAVASEVQWVTIWGSIKTSSTAGDISVIFAPVLTQGGVMRLGSWANFTEK